MITEENLRNKNLYVLTTDGFCIVGGAIDITMIPVIDVQKEISSLSLYQESVFECQIPLKGLLYLLGFNTTNNYRKIHGGIMTRKIRRK